MKHTFFITLLIILVVAGGIWFLPRTDQPITFDQATSTTQSAAPDTTDWQGYENEAFDFTFRYPDRVDTAVEAGRVKAQLIGPGSEPQTEVTGGFTLTIYTQSTDGLSIQEFATQEYEQQTQGLQGVSQPQRVTISDHTGHTFVVEGAMGSGIRYYILSAGSDEVYVATANISDPNEVGYVDTVRTILSTLEER
ncbi:MAG: hypothetical protein WD335_03075 [Candidatus Paceibacterota bacterium]